MKHIFLYTAFLFLVMSSCNQTVKEEPATEAVNAEDSAAYELKVASEDLDDQAESLDTEIDSVINSLN